ncbi:MAG: hypothetical protein LBT50_06525 [Prevotellaceae bacterium]|jgi:hypothetical protein|nr:hypothetical protein [Prevotellaceae bacterium]
MIKGFNLSINYVLYEMSYVNLIMYNAVIPSYSSDKDKAVKEVVDADKDPERAANILFGD